jgi:hypothetical protein
MHDGTAVPLAVCLQFLGTKATLGPTLCNIHRPYIHMHKHPGRRSHFIHTCIPSLPHPSTFPQHSTMEPAKRMAASGSWDRLPEEIVSLITVMVAETLEDPLVVCGYATRQRRG